ncbi:MAG: response regulator [Burkholderiales bacterium]|nr:response regulator [Burkholderiales bacterium]
MAALLGAGSLAFMGYLPTPYVIMPLLIWAGVRFHVRGAAVALALTTLMSALFTWGGADQYAGQPEALRREVVAMQIFLAVSAISALLVAALAHQRGRALEALRVLNRDLEEGVAERTSTLARERERLTVALRAGQMGVYEWRVGERSVWWSPEMYAVFGVESGVFTPTVESFNALVFRGDRAELWRETEESLSAREVFTHEYRIVRPDGAVRWVVNRAHVGLDRAGNVQGMTGVAADITERKLAEQALHEADRRKDEFIVTLAHELRNPLAPIRNAVEVVKGAATPAQRDWAGRVIERQVVQMARLLDDLLDVSRISRISRKTVDLRIERVALAAVVESAIETSQPLIQAGRHELVVRLPEEPVWIETDSLRLAQVLSNLLNDAAKYTEAGGRIELAAQRTPMQVAVSVQDNGIGIEAEMLARVFEMFLQDKPALELSQGGLGIGLSLAKRLVEAMNGQIEVRSEGPGRGSTFTVRLPAGRSVPDTAAAGDTLHSPPSLSKRSFLIVDDLADSADSLALMLKLLGHDAYTAYDGEQALDAILRHRPDVAVLDLGMPRMDGYQVCERIRARQRGRQMCVIALSGWGTQEDRRRTLARGFDGHLVKPVEVAELLEAVEAGGRVQHPVGEAVRAWPVTSTRPCGPSPGS